MIVNKYLVFERYLTGGPSGILPVGETIKYSFENGKEVSKVIDKNVTVIPLK